MDVVVQYATESLAIALIFRLLWLRDARTPVYSAFALFLFIQLMGALGYFACRHWALLDYRLEWFVSTALLDLCSLYLAYSLAKAVLAELPGILRFSRRLLNAAFVVAIVVAFSTAKSEYWLTPARNFRALTDQLIYAFMVADKGISMASVIILIATLAFILWFPVKIPRNLAVFSIGLVVFFAAKATLKLVSIYRLQPRQTLDLDLSISCILILCFVYWIVFMTPEGQATEVRIGHRWRREEQDRLLNQLEALNSALLNTSRQFRGAPPREQQIHP